MSGAKIVLTGGGTAGHVLPNIALAPRLSALGFELCYVGSHGGLERGLAEGAGLPYFGISSGKLRRYFSLANFTDVFRIAKGVWDSFRLLGRLRPALVFSKGGFVTVPLVLAARLRGVKVVIHESDLTPGLANRLAAPFAEKILVSFPESLGFVDKKKALLTGVPLRDEMLRGDAAEGLRFLGFQPGGLPVLLVTGGSLGSRAINAEARRCLPELLGRFRVALICGAGNLSGIRMEGYREYEFLRGELPHVMAAADVVVSRAGAGTLFELLALKKPHVLVPLTLGQSRGDQIANAESFRKRGFSEVLPESGMAGALPGAVAKVYDGRRRYADAMAAAQGAETGGAADMAVACVLDILGLPASGRG